MIKRKTFSSDDIKKFKEKSDKIQDESFSEFENVLKKNRKKLKNIPDDDVKHKIVILKGMLATVKAMIVIVEKQFQHYKSANTAYPMVALVKEAREILVDLKQLQNNDTTVAHVYDNILSPNVKLIAQSFIQNCQQIKLKQKNSKTKKEIDKFMLEHAKLVDEILASMRDSLNNYYKKQ